MRKRGKIHGEKILQEIKSAERLKRIWLYEKKRMQRKAFPTIFDVRKNTQIKQRRNTRSKCSDVVTEGRGKVSKELL
jgi:hypothetical protein